MALMLMTVVTWNLQRVSLREQNRGRLRRVAEWVEQRGWEVVFFTELFGEGEGVIWMGEDEHRTALVHGRKAGVLLIEMQKNMFFSNHVFYAKKKCFL